MELSNSNIKKFLLYSQKKAFLILQEKETPEKFIYISENKTFFYFRKRKP